MHSIISYFTLLKRFRKSKIPKTVFSYNFQANVFTFNLIIIYGYIGVYQGICLKIIAKWWFLVFLIFEIFSTKCENSILLNTKMHFIFNFPNQMFQFLFFWSWIGPNKVMTLKKPWSYFKKPMSSSDLVWGERQEAWICRGDS